MNLSSKLGLNDVLGDLKGKRVLMRVDFNVPLKDGKVKDPTRIKATLPSIKAILRADPKCLVLMSHLGRPDGQRSEKNSLQPVVPVLESLLNHNITFLSDCVGECVQKAVLSAQGGQIIVLENLRFYAEEEGSGLDEKGNKVKPSAESVAKFRQQLTSLGEVYINDAFGTAHRAHSSMTGIDLPVRAAGYLMKKEIDYFGKALENPERPLLVILGGAKVKDKIKLIMSILDVANEMIIGGGMAFTFLKVLNNMNIGSSLFDEEGSKIIADIMKKAEAKNVKIHLPVDFICGDKFDAACNTKYFTLESGIEAGWGGYDIGDKSIALNSQAIARAKTVIWNGPQGVFEMAPFKKGSVTILNDLIAATAKGVMTIAGGGDTVALVQTVAGAEEKLSHVSTGGGASLELLEGTYLPGVKFLGEKKN